MLSIAIYHSSNYSDIQINIDFSIFLGQGMYGYGMPNRQRQPNYDNSWPTSYEYGGNNARRNNQRVEIK